MNTTLRDNKLDGLSTHDHDMKKRRVINASPSQDSTDYIIQAEMFKLQSELLKAINDLSTVVVNLDLDSIKPSSFTLNNGQIIKTRNVLGVVRNLLTHFTDDVVYLDNPDGAVSIRPAAGADVKSTTSFDAAVSYKVAGTKVVGTQQADVGVAATPAALFTTNTSGATYTSTEQIMLAQLKTDVTNLRTTVLDFKTRLDNIRTLIRNHGLSA